jgi:tRNA(Ile)-lysidine synthase
MDRNIEAVFIETVQREAILPEGSRIAAAVSGGGDSMAMLMLLKRFSGHMNWELSVLHIDHRLRRSSGEDACFVCDAAEALELDYTCVKPDPPDGGSIEGEWSRIRHRVYEEHAQLHDALVAVGHTASDRAETLLMRLMEGSGLRGLGGMDYRGRGPVRRPLLDVTATETRAYLQAAGQKWLEDPSNSDPSILRNRIRLEIMPHIEGIRQGAELGLARAAAGLSDWRRTVFRVVDETVEKAGVRSGDSVRVDRKEFLSLPAALRLGLLWELSGRPRKGRLELEKTEKWLCEGGCGTRDMPGGAVLVSDPDGFTVEGAGGRDG